MIDTMDYSTIPAINAYYEGKNSTQIIHALTLPGNRNLPTVLCEIVVRASTALKPERSGIPMPRGWEPKENPEIIRAALAPLSIEKRKSVLTYGGDRSTIATIAYFLPGSKTIPSMILPTLFEGFTPNDKFEVIMAYPKMLLDAVKSAVVVEGLFHGLSGEQCMAAYKAECFGGESVSPLAHAVGGNPFVRSYPPDCNPAAVQAGFKYLSLPQQFEVLLTAKGALNNIKPHVMRELVKDWLSAQGGKEGLNTMLEQVRDTDIKLYQSLLKVMTEAFPPPKLTPKQAIDNAVSRAEENIRTQGPEQSQPHLSSSQQLDHVLTDGVALRNIEPTVMRELVKDWLVVQGGKESLNVMLEQVRRRDFRLYQSLAKVMTLAFPPAKPTDQQLMNSAIIRAEQSIIMPAPENPQPR